MYCAFTAGASTWEAKATADCTKHPHVAYLLCACCSGGKPLYRCSVCYHKFQAAIKRRQPLIERQLKAKLFTTPEIEALLQIDFKGLAHGADAAAQPMLCEARGRRRGSAAGIRI